MSLNISSPHTAAALSLIQHIRYIRIHPDRQSCHQNQGHHGQHCRTSPFRYPASAERMHTASNTYLSQFMFFLLLFQPDHRNAVLLREQIPVLPHAEDLVNLCFADHAAVLLSSI